MAPARVRLALLAAVTVLIVAAIALRDRSDADDQAAGGPSETTAPAGPASSDTTSTTVPASPTTAPTTAGSLPAPGDGGGVEPTDTYALAPGISAVVGTGPLITYTVEVEQGIPLAPPDFAAEVDRILADPRGWTRDGARSFQRIDNLSAPGFRLILATPASTDELCAPLRTNGIFSCFNHGAAVINLDRWNLGAEAQSGLPLPEYRNYVISHEVGHALGFGHVACPAPGAPAPVMMQQTKGLDGCAPNPWPYP